MILIAQKIELVQKLKEISNSHFVFPEFEVQGKKGLKLNRIGFIHNSEVEIHDSNSDVCASNTTSSLSHHALKISNRTCIVIANLAPQDICIEIRIDVDVQKYYSLS